MSPDDPRHGTRAGYIQHCKDGGAQSVCAPCREGKRRTDRRYKKNRRRGWTGKVPVNRTLRHLRRLQAAGWSMARVSAATGVSEATLSRLMTGAEGEILTTTSAKILALAVVEDPNSDQVPVYRARRRLQALQALGWSMVEIGTRIGWSQQNLNGLVTERWRPRETVSRRTFDQIDTVYRELCMRTPAASRWTTATVTRAAKRGWVPPLGWDDIDDPNETPDTTVEKRPSAGRPERITQVLEDFEWLRSQGVSEHHAAERAGVALVTIRDYERRVVRRARADESDRLKETA